jgi:NADPH:quinone reductase-like Zn-dependent oxidoreductase
VRPRRCPRSVCIRRGPLRRSLSSGSGIPRVGAGEALVRVHAAAITRDELEWPVDRLPAIPSYELSGTIAVDASTASDFAVGDRVWALTGFDRDGAAAEYALVPVAFLAA